MATKTILYSDPALRLPSDTCTTRHRELSLQETLRENELITRITGWRPGKYTAEKETNR